MRVRVTPWDPTSRRLEPLDETSLFTDYEKIEHDFFDPVILGKLWLEIELHGWKHTQQSIEVIASLDESQKKGTVALLSPNSDYHSQSNPNRQSSLDYDPVEKESKIYVECKSWDLGKESRLTIHRSPDIEEDLSLKLLLLLRPHFKSPNQTCKFNLDVVDKYDSNTSLLDDEAVMLLSRYELICSNELPKDDTEKMGYVHDVFTNYNAYSYGGNGNSLHPKQYLTVHGMNHIVKNYLSDKDDIKVGYIGTDTTENFCSMIRWLDSSGMIDRVSQIEVYYTNEWDSEFLSSLGSEHPLNKHEKVRKFEIDENLIDTATSCDIIIATYVTQWAGWVTHGNYKQLLTKLMGKNSYLLSVDPQNAEKSVRSPLISKTNNQVLYEEYLKFKLAKRPSKNQNSAVEWAVWKRRNSNSGVN